MARFARIDSQIRADRLILANRFKFPEPNPFLCELRFGGLKIANCRFEAIRANHSHCERYDNSHRVLQGAAQRGAQFYFIFAVLRTLFSCSEMSFVALKTCTPLKATP